MDIVKIDKKDLTVSNKADQYQSLIELAITQNADVDKLEKLMDLQDRFEQKEAKKAYVRALSRFQSNCPVIKKTKQGHNYKYAPLCDVMEQVKELESECGLSHRFEQKTDSDFIKITCVLSHVDGHSERLTLEALADKSGSKNSVQAIGSTISYLQRYSYLGSLGIATADEDMDGRIPNPEGKSGNWRAGKDYNLLPKALREVFLAAHEYYELADYQANYEVFQSFTLHEERIAVWKCFASDERSKLNAFFKSDECNRDVEIQSVEYLKGRELESFLKGCE